MSRPLADFLQAVPQPILLYHPETYQVLEANAAALSTYGYTREEFLQKQVTEVRPKQDMEACLANPRPSRLDQWVRSRHIDKKGAVFDVEVWCSDVRFGGRTARLAAIKPLDAGDSSGSLSAPQVEALLNLLSTPGSSGLSSLWNKTEVHAAERDREIAARRLEATLENVGEALFILDEDWRFTFVNTAAAQLIGRPREKLLGQSLWDAFPTAIGSRFEHEYRLARESNAARKFQERAETLNVWLEASVYPANDHLAVYLRDVTRERTLEQAVAQAQRLEAVGQQTGGVAHDFNNLLTVILGNSELLENALQDQADLKEFAGLTRMAAERGVELVRMLLAFSRRQPLEPRPTDVNALVQEAAALIRRSLGAHIELDLALGADLASAQIDPTQLESALLNLCINARDAMESGGRITIETREAVLDGDEIGSPMSGPPGAYVLIAVTDTGHGMDRQTLARAFEPFFTTKPFGKGSGLGLSTIYGFVKQSRGHINIYSEPGVGTTVKLYLPRSEAADAAPRQAPRGEVRYPRGVERILLVEDDELVRAHGARMLTGLGYSVVTAADGPSALEAVEAAGHFDLLLTDVFMPGGLNGAELARAVRQRLPGVAVLYTSGYTENTIIHNGRLDEGVNLLQKPYRRQDLAQKVRSVLDQRKASADAP